MPNGTPSPATAPAEAPEIKSIQELQAKKADILVYLKNIPNITDEEKQKLEEQYTQALDLLNGKTDAEKARLLTGIADDISKLRNNLQNEKEDANEGNDTVETDETTTVTEQKLNVENEAKAHLEAFRASIETKLAAPDTPETPPSGSPEPAEVADDFLPALNIKADLPDIPEFRNPKKKGGIVEFIINWLGTEGIFGWLRKNIMGYTDVEEMTDTMSAMNNIMSIKKESPVSAIMNLSHLTEYDFRDILRKNNKLDFTNMRNVEAAFLGKHAKDAKLAPYHSIYKGIEDMAGKIGTLDASSYNPIQGFAELLSYSKKPEFAPEYTVAAVVADVSPTPEAEPTPTEAEQEAEALKSAQELDEAQNQAQKELDQAEAIPDNPEAINTATDKLKAAKEAVAEGINDSKQALEELVVEEDANLKKITEIDMPMAQRSLTEAESALAGDPENTELKAKKEALQKNLDTLKEKAESLKGALKKIREEILVKFDGTPGITTALAAVNLYAEADSIIDIANGAIEVAETKTENQTAEEKEKADKETEKVKKEKEKFFGIYKKIKDPENKDGYYHDTDEDYMYVIGENGGLYKYEYNGGWLDRFTTWGLSIKENDDGLLPKDHGTGDENGKGNIISELQPDGTWKETEMYDGHKSGFTWPWETWNKMDPISPWAKHKDRMVMRNKAPDTPDWYNS